MKIGQPIKKLSHFADKRLILWERLTYKCLPIILFPKIRPVIRQIVVYLSHLVSLWKLFSGFSKLYGSRQILYGNLLNLINLFFLLDLKSSHHFKVDLIVQCIRTSENPQTHHHALMLLTTAAKLFPVSLGHANEEPDKLTWRCERCDRILYFLRLFSVNSFLKITCLFR
jgi:hypothetical protein